MNERLKVQSLVNGCIKSTIFCDRKHTTIYGVVTCVALAKAGLVVGTLRPSVRLSVRSSVRPFVCPQQFWGA